MSQAFIKKKGDDFFLLLRQLFNVLVEFSPHTDVIWLFDTGVDGTTLFVTWLMVGVVVRPAAFWAEMMLLEIK